MLAISTIVPTICESDASPFRRGKMTVLDVSVCQRMVKISLGERFADGVDDTNISNRSVRKYGDFGVF